MITPQYCRTMAQYNQWQNNGLRDLVKVMDEDDLRLDRGAFFGSILGTLNHLLWADTIWMHRFGAGDAPQVPVDQHLEMTPNKHEWDRARFIMDGQIREWAAGLHAVDLAGDLTWFSGLKQQNMSDPIALCVTHFFNHQTHHRGQVHAMMTAAGMTPIETDLAFMSET